MESPPSAGCLILLFSIGRQQQHRRKTGECVHYTAKKAGIPLLISGVVAGSDVRLDQQEVRLQQSVMVMAHIRVAY